MVFFFTRGTKNDKFLPYVAYTITIIKKNKLNNLSQQ